MATTRLFTQAQSDLIRAAERIAAAAAKAARLREQHRHIAPAEQAALEAQILNAEYILAMAKDTHRNLVAQHA